MKWRKILWVKQDFPDNYVDDSFLDEMQRNVNVEAYDYWSLVRESGAIVQHLSTIIIFTTVFHHAFAGKLSIMTLISAGTSLTLVEYIIWESFLRNYLKMARVTKMETLKSTFLFFLTLLGLSPILRTLTQDISDDTIWALTITFFIINLIFNDYRTCTSDNIKNPSSLSLNAAIFSSVLLASRFNSNIQVFGVMVFAVEIFAIFPIFRRAVKLTSPIAWALMTIGLSLIAMVSTYSLSSNYVYVYVMCISFIQLICPAWLIWIQRYKNEIRGPWDEAVLSGKRKSI